METGRAALTKNGNDFPALCMFQAKHSDDQTEERTCYNHDNA